LLDRNGPVWESGYYDYLPGSREKLKARIRCIRENPVREKLGNDSRDYPFGGVNYEKN